MLPIGTLLKLVTQGEGCLVGRLDDEYTIEQAMGFVSYLINAVGGPRFTYGREVIDRGH
jgi:hypothetical protein